MAWYRLYQIGAGHFLQARDFEADDDSGALAYAGERLRFDEVEIWQERRLVGRISRPAATMDPDPLPT